MKENEKYLYIKEKWCKKCMVCVEFCPKKVFEVDDRGYPFIAHLDKCIECNICVAMCPEFAIFANPDVTKKFEGR